MPFNLSYVEQLLYGKIHLSDWRDFNDVMEGVFTFVSDVNDNYNQRRLAEINSAKKRFRIACFADARKPGGWSILRSHLMWGHYADSHKGLAIELDIADNGCLESSGWCLEKIQYANKLSQLYDFGKEPSSIYKFAKKLLLTKQVDWNKEREIRLIVDVSSQGNKDNNKDFFDGSTCVKPVRVYLGSRFCVKSKKENASDAKKEDADKIELLKVLNRQGIECVDIASEYPDNFMNKMELKQWHGDIMIDGFNIP